MPDSLDTVLSASPGDIAAAGRIKEPLARKIAEPLWCAVNVVVDAIAQLMRRPPPARRGFGLKTRGQDCRAGRTLAGMKVQ